jgi:hypothetical protein
MMVSEPNASAIITNPTTLALQYHRGISAPVCLVKGRRSTSPSRSGKSPPGTTFPSPRTPERALYTTVDVGEENLMEHLPCARRNHRLRHEAAAHLLRPAGMRRRGCGTAGKEAKGRLDGLAFGRPIQAVEEVTRKPRVTLIPFGPHHQP